MLRNSGYILLLLGTFLGSCCGFTCRVCSYSSSSDHNTDCIDSPDLLTAPGNIYHCNRTCVVQENYSLEEEMISSYIRTCSSVEKSGFCVQDVWSRVCYYSCIGPMCNDNVGALHDIFPVLANDRSGGNTGNSYTYENGSYRVTGNSLVFVFVVLMSFVVSWII
ncbi:hypothetical protein V1264_008537 [Littorina saxatilis]|uniref:Uncharacterized protein n=1 Tax=Littorina saxatilis TaxID=31220 RepID=A0AAN9G2E3_9CAEN